MELRNVNRQLLFPTAVWMIEYDNYQGVNYVRTPQDCGNLRLLDDRKYRIGEPDSATANALTGHWVDVPAREGLMVIFPSWLSHQVGENRSSEPRVSLSMNAALRPKGSPYGMRLQG